MKVQEKLNGNWSGRYVPQGPSVARPRIGCRMGESRGALLRACIVLVRLEVWPDGR